MEISKKLVIMRGLPFTGKSYRANQLIQENPEGVIYSTDEFWYTQNHPERPEEYSFNPRYLGIAHKWNLLRAQKAIEEGKPLIIIDNTNTRMEECLPYVKYAYFQDYEICIEEPTSDSWKEIKLLLEDKRANKKELKKWVKILAEGSKATHSVPEWALDRMMWRWQDFTVEEAIEVIDQELNYG